MHYHLKMCSLPTKRLIQEQILSVSENSGSYEELSDQ